MAFLLPLGVILLLILSLKYVDKDFLSPVNLYLLFALLSTLGLFLCYKEWDVNEYGAGAVGLFIVGSICFVLGCFIARQLFVRIFKKPVAKETGNKNGEGSKEAERIEVGLVRVVLMTLVSLAALYGTWAYLLRLEGDSNTVTIAKAINNRRTMDIQGKLVGELAKGRVWMLFTEFSGVFAIFCVMVFVRNAVNKKFKARDMFLCLPVGICALEYVSLSNRGGIILIAFTAVTSWFVAEKLCTAWEKTINKKIVKFVLLAGLIFIPVFFLSLYVMGRRHQLEAYGYKEYTAIYLSGGVRCLDLYVKEPIDSPKRFGEETLLALHENLYSRFGIGEHNTRYLEWRELNERPVANTYTSFRRFYHDFGVLGVAILSFLQGVIISGLYYGIQKRSQRDRISFLETMYCYLAHTTVYILIDDLFFSSWASLYGIKMVAIMFAVYFFLFRIVRKEDGGIGIDWKGTGLKNA